MVGNLSEWVADWMQDNSDVDNGSINSSTYGSDILNGIDESGDSSGNRFPAVLIRGGAWGNLTAAGIFNMGSDNQPTNLDASFGFRCAR